MNVLITDIIERRDGETRWNISSPCHGQAQPEKPGKLKLERRSGTSIEFEMQGKG